MAKYEEPKLQDSQASNRINNRKFRYGSVFQWIFIVVLVALSWKLFLQQRRRPRENPLFAPPDIQHHWGSLSPYYVQREYEDPPSECVVNQVNIIHRHGARFPEPADHESTRAAVMKYQKAKRYSAKEMQFLNDYTYDLGSDSLVQLGAEQSWLSGAGAYSRYSSLIDEENPPFLRASLSDRVVMSAQNWSAGFHESSKKYKPEISVYLDEGPHSNNTLFNGDCPKAHNGKEQMNQWVNVYASPIARRLNSAAVDLPANLTAEDTFYLMMMCPFESVHHRKFSPFCKLFNVTEFKGFEYARDVQLYYTTGYGQDQNLGRVQGVGYVNELLARLTNQPVNDSTQTNHTLDDDERTFPLGRKMYVDFSHDHLMAAVYSAIGLFNGSHLDPTEINPNRSWLTSKIMPFSSRMTVERLHCSARTPGRFYKSRSESEKMKERNGDYIRILVNDVVQPLGFCGGDKQGLCELGKFVDSQGYARSDGDGDFRRCGYKPRQLAGNASLQAPFLPEIQEDEVNFDPES